MARTRDVEHFFNVPRTTSTLLHGIDLSKISDTMYEAAFGWKSPRRKYHQRSLYSRPFTNPVPRNAREIATLCAHCRISGDIDIYIGHMRPKNLLREAGWYQRENGLFRPYVLGYDGKTLRRWVQIPFGALLVPGMVEDLIAEQLAKAKVDFVRRHWYPFAFKEWSVAKGDIFHCLLCAMSALVVKHEGEVLEWKEIDLQRDMAEFFTRLCDLNKRGLLLKLENEENAQKYAGYF